MVANHEKIGAEKKAAVAALIPAEWRLEGDQTSEEQRMKHKDVTGSYIHQFLSKDEIEITETDAVNIAKKTSSGQWKAADVTKAFCHRAALAHQLTNCLLEIFFDIANQRAKELDDYVAKHGKPMGPLHGVPVSLKDQLHVKGVETSMGYVGWIGTFQGQKGTGKEKNFESELVTELLALGAVLYCKTSVPQTLMAGESMNYIMGYVWNPKNRLLSAGGSSGGEGALIGLRGSPLGFGTDIGGSIRIPSAFNGLYGLRPSSGRVPYEGMANSMDGQNTILSVVGPMATTADSLKFCFEALMTQKPWLHDPLVLEIPYRKDQEEEILSKKKLAFGLVKHDGFVAPHPPVKRALDDVAHMLRRLGHDVVDWNPSPSHPDLSNLAIKSWMFDGAFDVHSALSLSGEPPIPQIQAVYGKTFDQMNATAISKTNIEKREAQKAYMEFWNQSASLTSTGEPIDAIISPLAPFAAARPETYRYYGYSVFVNLLDYTSVVIPVTTVEKKIDIKNTDYAPLNDTDKYVQEIYDPQIYDGAHVSIQLVGRRLQEEKMLALAKYISDALASGH